MTDKWRNAALCAQVGGEFWFPEKGGSVREAKAICAECPVRAQCLQFAQANDERFGVWGGFSERERRRMRGKPMILLPGGGGIEEEETWDDEEEAA